MITENINATGAMEGAKLMVAYPNPEVPDKAVRRRFTAEYELGIFTPLPMPAENLEVWECFCAGRGCMHQTSKCGVSKESGEYCQP